jgi:hypothetical protein
MGLMDRDYWRNRYNRRTNGGIDLDKVRAGGVARPVPSDDTYGPEYYLPQDRQLVSRPRDEGPSFLLKLVITFATAFICVLAYRYLR